ncbi:MAG: peptide chain release factor N(5)-glutamine methyltransferase [Acidobacteriota bacterium]
MSRGPETSEATTIAALLEAARRGLADAPFEAPRREGALLLAHVLGRSEASILAFPEAAVAAPDAERFHELLGRRLSGEPVAYLFGEREFYGRPFRVDSRVLIPRPETEHIVDAVLRLELTPAARIVDVGTGSGCLAVTLALELPEATVTATDRSPAALAVARDNAQRLGAANRVALFATDLTAGLRLEAVDLVVSNPPYVDPSERDSLSVEVVGFEPHLALFAPGRGHSVVARLLVELTDLRPGTHLILEIGYDQSAWLEAAVAELDAWRLIEILDDYSGIPRTAVLRRAGPVD